MIAARLVHLWKKSWLVIITTVVAGEGEKR